MRDDFVIRCVVAFAWCAILLGMVLRVTQLPSRTIFNDEGYTQLRVAGHTADEMQRKLYTGAPMSPLALQNDVTVGSHASAERLVSSLVKEDAQHPPLFYLAELAIVKVLGNSLTVWRILPALFGILAIGAVFALARELFNEPHAALLAAAAFAVSPIERIYSNQAREYSLFTLLFILATLAVVRAVRSNAVNDWSLYAVVATAGLYANPFMAYVIAAHSVFILGSARTKLWTTLPRFALAVFASLIAYAPWIYQIVVHRADIAQTNVWSSQRWPFARLAVKWVFNVGSTFFDLEYIDLRWSVVFAVVAVVAIIAIIRGFRNANVETRWCLGAAIAIPALVLAAPDIVLGQHRSSVARYGLPVYAMLSIVAAKGLVRRPFATVAILSAGICACAVGSIYPSWWDNDSNADDARIGTIISSVPHAQVVSTIAPPLFVNIARFLSPDIRVSLNGDLALARFSANDPLFVLRPTAGDLNALRKKTGLVFDPIPFTRTLTAHSIGTSIGNTPDFPESADLYRARSAQNQRR